MCRSPCLPGWAVCVVCEDVTELRAYPVSAPPVPGLVLCCLWERRNSTSLHCLPHPFCREEPSLLSYGQSGRRRQALCTGGSRTAADQSPLYTYIDLHIYIYIAFYSNINRIFGDIPFGHGALPDVWTPGLGPGGVTLGGHWLPPTSHNKEDFLLNVFMFSTKH